MVQVKMFSKILVFGEEKERERALVFEGNEEMAGKQGTEGLKRLL